MLESWLKTKKKKNVELVGDSNTSSYKCTWNGPQNLGGKTGGTRNQGKNRNYIIA